MGLGTVSDRWTPFLLKRATAQHRVLRGCTRSAAHTVPVCRVSPRPRADENPPGAFTHTRETAQTDPTVTDTRAGVHVHPAPTRRQKVNNLRRLSTCFHSTERVHTKPSQQSRKASDSGGPDYCPPGKHVHLFQGEGVAGRLGAGLRAGTPREPGPLLTAQSSPPHVLLSRHVRSF